jgi:hypothetical protein
MEGSCNTDREMTDGYRIVVENLKGSNLLGDKDHKDNISIWIHLAQDSDQWWAIMNMLKKPLATTEGC